MIIATKRNNVEIEEVIESSGKMHVNTEAHGHLIRLLTRAYSDKIGSIVRETTANAKDSHIMANVDTPVIVRIKEEDNGEYSFEVEDKGLGLDNEEFYKYIMGLGQSTKTLISNVLGGFGLGSKAASSYHEDGSYYYTCRKNGIERKYMIFAGEQTPDSTKLYEKPTTESIGVIVTIPIKNGDKREFISKIEEQLCYFSGVYFENCGIENNFKIYRHDLFQWSDLCQDSNLHISLDDVYYPLDYNKLGIKPINIPIALRFKLEEALITPIPNRENIEYTKETKKAILDKIKLVANWFVNKYNENNTELTDLKDLYNHFYYNDRYVKIQEQSICIKDLLQYTSIQLVTPKFKDVNFLNLKTIYEEYHNFLKCYSVVREISYNKFKYKNFYDKNNIIERLRDRQTLIICNTIPSKKKIEFIKDTIGDCVFIKKTTSYELNNYTKTKWIDNNLSLYKKLKLKNYPKDQWRSVINDWLNLEKLYENQCLREESIIVTKEWIDSKKVKRGISTRNQKLHGEINFKFAKRLKKYSNDWSCKFVSEVLKIEDFYKRKVLTVYGEDGDRRLLDNLWNIAKKDRKVVPCIIGERDAKKLKDTEIHNLIHINKFMTEYSKTIARYATAYKIEELCVKYDKIFYQINFIKDINQSFSVSLQTLEDYSRQYENPNNDLMKELVAICEKNNWWDYSIYTIYQEVIKNIDKIDFLKYFIQRTSGYGSEEIHKDAIPIIKELLIARKFKMDYTNYPLSTQVLLPETEETPILEEEPIENEV